MLQLCVVLCLLIYFSVLLKYQLDKVHTVIKSISISQFFAVQFSFNVQGMDCLEQGILLSHRF